MESMTHEYAKNTVLRWLTEPPNMLDAIYVALKVPVPWSQFRPDAAFAEYPICIDSQGRLRGCGFDIWPEVPTYAQCIEQRLLPVAIFDAVGIRTGRLTDVFEVVHRHRIDADKARYMRRIWLEHPFHLHVLAAKPILWQDKRPLNFDELYLSFFGNGDWPCA